MIKYNIPLCLLSFSEKSILHLYHMQVHKSMAWQKLLCSPFIASICFDSQDTKWQRAKKSRWEKYLGLWPKKAPVRQAYGSLTWDDQSEVGEAVQGRRIFPGVCTSDL